VRSIPLAAILATGTLLLPAVPATNAQITSYECQQQFREMAGPYLQRALWYANAADAFPVTPAGRPYLGPGPVGAYPGFQGMVAAPGGPAWGVANGFGVNSVGQYAQLNALTAGAFNVPAVTQAFIAATPGGLPNLGTANLATLAPLQQGLAGNILSAAATREAVIGNRLSAASLWTTISSYPLAQAGNYQDMVSLIQTWVENTCPAARPTDAPRASASGSRQPED
jgi:hypothetical protein